MNLSWWIIALKIVCFLILMTLLVSWMGRMRDKPRPEQDKQLLIQPRSTLIIGTWMLVFFATLMITSAIYSSRHEFVISALLLSVFILFSFCLIAEYYFARHYLSETGITYRRMTGSRGFVRWRDICQVQYDDGMKWFRLKTAAGKTVRISAMIMGLPVFAALVLQNVLPNALDDQTKKVLQQTAAGHPPSIWMSIQNQ